MQYLAAAMQGAVSFLKKYCEQLLWLAGLVLLFCLNPASSSFSLCFFKLLGFNSCPGCGLGHAIHHLLHLHLRASFEAHKLGGPALLFIAHTILKPFFYLSTQTR